MFTELFREEKKEEGERGVQEDKRGMKRRETDPASNQFPKCSPPSGTNRNSQSWVEKRGGREVQEGGSIHMADSHSCTAQHHKAIILHFFLRANRKY